MLAVDSVLSWNPFLNPSRALTSHWRDAQTTSTWALTPLTNTDRTGFASSPLPQGPGFAWGDPQRDGLEPERPLRLVDRERQLGGPSLGLLVSKHLR